MHYGSMVEPWGRESSANCLTRIPSEHTVKNVEVINASAVAAATFIEKRIGDWERGRLINAETGKALKLRGVSPERASNDLHVDRKTIINYLREPSWPQSLPYSDDVDKFTQALRPRFKSRESIISKRDARKLVESIKRRGSRSVTTRGFLLAMEEAGILKDLRNGYYEILSTTYIVGDQKTAMTMIRRCKESLDFLASAEEIHTLHSDKISLDIEQAREFTSSLEPSNVAPLLGWFDRIERDSKPTPSDSYNTVLFLCAYQLPEHPQKSIAAADLSASRANLHHVIASAPFCLVNFNLVPVWCYSKSELLVQSQSAFTEFFRSVADRALKLDRTSKLEQLNYQLQFSIFQPNT